MSDDIVTRLRKPLPYNLVGLTTKDLGNERYEAADEIERLRAEVSRLTILANLWESEFNAAVNALTGKVASGE